jgi:hypothetical protein
MRENERAGTSVPDIFQPIRQELYQFCITVYVPGNSEEFFGHPLGFDGQIFLHKEGILVVSIIFPSNKSKRWRLAKF